MNKNTRSLLFIVLGFVFVAVCLSYFYNVPYIFTLLGFAVWAAVGHLVTITGDAPKGWSNPEGSVKIWHQSLLFVAAKFGFVVLLFILLAAFPVLREYGA